MIKPKKFNEDIELCSYLIYELLEDRDSLDYELIKVDLEHYSNIKKLVGENWITKMENGNNNTHPLLVFLSRKEKFLSHLENILNYIEPNEKGAPDIRKGLHDEENFWQAVSELEAIYLFRKVYGTKNVEIKPRIELKKGNPKYLDCKVKANHTSFLIEVVSPDSMDLLKYSSEAVRIKNRAIDIIYDEFTKKHKIKEAINIQDTPLIFVMDISRSEIDKRFIESTLGGSLQIISLFDKKTGESVAEYLSRAKDSLYHRDISTSIIFGILYYKREMNDQGNIFLHGNLVLNPYSNYFRDDVVVENANKIMEGVEK